MSARPLFSSFFVLMPETFPSIEFQFSNINAARFKLTPTRVSDPYSFDTGTHPDPAF